MTEAAPFTRRTVVGTGLTFIGLSAVAACSSSTAGSRADQSGGSDTSSKDTGGADGAIAELSAIPVGKAIATKIDGKDAVVARPTKDTAAAYTAICTHKGCTVDVDDAMLKCPCHGSEFNALTGAVTKGPATEDLASIKVKVADGKVVAG